MIQDQMNTEQMSEALDAIHKEAERLLQKEMPQEVEQGLELILSIARYKFDDRDMVDGDDEIDGD